MDIGKESLKERTGVMSIEEQRAVAEGLNSEVLFSELHRRFEVNEAKLEAVCNFLKEGEKG